MTIRSSGRALASLSSLAVLRTPGIRSALLPCCISTSKNETDMISPDLVESMPKNQKAIYYISIDSLQSAKTAPFLENLIQKDIEI
jgi:HSP90 family molecular chaperone